MADPFDPYSTEDLERLLESQLTRLSNDIMTSRARKVTRTTCLELFNELTRRRWNDVFARMWVPGR